MTPAEKLDRSRLALIESMAGRERPSGAGAAGQDAFDDEQREDDARAEGAGLFGRNRWLGGITSVARAWWSHHPAHLAVEMATPALGSYMLKRPFQVLAVSAGVGALLVVTRPWRLLSLTTLVVAVVKSSQLSGVVMSALSHAQGWQEQRRDREPH